VDRHDHQLDAGILGRATERREPEGLLEGVGHDAVDGADADADPGDPPTRSPSLDRLEHALAVAHLVHGETPYIDRMRR
jgi:hypothetical protein